MDTKLLQKIAIGLICLSVLVLIGLTIFQHQLLKKMSQGASQETTVSKESTGGSVSGPGEAVQKGTTGKATITGKEPNKDEIDELEYQLGAAEEELDIAHEQLSEEAARKSEASKNMAELQKKMLEDPATVKRLRSLYQGQLDILYDTLYKELNLTPEKLDQLKDLLTDQMMSFLDISQGMLGVPATEEKRKEVQQQFEDIKKANDSKISALLGSQDFQTYESYRDTLTERQVVEGFAESLSVGDKITEAQQQDLINSMYQERKSIYSERGYPEDKVTFPSELNDEGIAKIMEINDRTYEGYIRGANIALSASQMEQLKTYLKNQRDMLESQLKLSAQMLGGQTTQESADKKSE